MDNIIEVNKQAWEFFLYQDLGIVPKWMFESDKYKQYIKEKILGEKLYKNFEDKLKDLNYDYYCVIMCAKAAYYDLSRTLRYGDNYKKSQDKDYTVNAECIKLATKIYRDKIINPYELFKSFVSYDDNKKEIINDDFKLTTYLTKNGDKKFYFGQAQKWVNMTLKYLYLLGLIDNPENLHIPIDSYILDALKKKNIKPSKEQWSKFSYDDYKKLKNDYTGSIEKPVLEWEHKAWIEISEKRKGVK